MTNYEKLVKALRWCADEAICCDDFNGEKCPYYDVRHDSCTTDAVLHDAADAIEALRKRLVSALTALHLANEKMGYYGIQPYTEADGEDMISDWVKTLVHEELEQQLPKREEVWKDVIGYEGLYQVSDQARVRNNKGKILKQSVKVGKCVYYKYVKLYKDGQYRQGYVHRMMAECFIPNPDNLPIINHKDEDGTNNRLDNLEWCTVEYNSNYGNAKRNMSRGKRRRAKMEVQDG